jgi:hypothetical protein
VATQAWLLIRAGCCAIVSWFSTSPAGGFKRKLVIVAVNTPMNPILTIIARPRSIVIAAGKDFYSG